MKIRSEAGTLVLGSYRVWLYLAPTWGRLFVFMKSEPDAVRFSLSVYVWPVVFAVNGPLRRNLNA